MIKRSTRNGLLERITGAVAAPLIYMHEQLNQLLFGLEAGQDELAHEEAVQSSRPVVHRHHLKRTESIESRRPLRAQRPARPGLVLPQDQKRESNGSTESTIMKRNPSDSIERSSSSGDLHDLYDELAMTQETMRQGQKQIHPFRPSPCRAAAGPGRLRGHAFRASVDDLDEKRDLLHVQARLDALQVQAGHAAKLIQRLTRESQASAAPSLDVSTVSVPQEA